MKARFHNAGQSCVCAKRFIVEAPVAERFTQLFVDDVRQLKVSDPFDRTTDVGPLARADLREQLQRQVDTSVDAARLADASPFGLSVNIWTRSRAADHDRRR